MVQIILATGEGRHLLRVMRNIVLTGLGIIIPVVVTAYIIWFIIDVLSGILGPFVDLLEWVGIVAFFERREVFALLIETGLYDNVIGVLSEIIAILTFVALVLAIGFFARHQYGELIISLFDFVISSIPGIGAVYQSLREVGDIVLNETAEEFEAVKLVELLSEETYVIAFKTNPAPDVVANGAGHQQMETLFIPMAPNPVTGGFLTYIPADRVHDVDLTIDEAVRAILTSGIANDQDAVYPPTVEDITGSDPIGEVIDPSVDHQHDTENRTDE